MRFLCFDIGGTGIKYGVAEGGAVSRRGRIATPTVDCRQTIPAAILEIIKKFSADIRLDGIGISSAGQIDNLSGEVIFATKNLPDFTGTRFKEIITGAASLPCEVENDVNAAALGEREYGAAIGENNFLLLTIGTGIGGAIMLDGRLLRGIRGSAGEVGHMIIQQGGLPCTCGMYGCFEQYASTGAMLRDYTRLTGHAIDGEELMVQVNRKEKYAVMVYEKFLDNLATGLAGLIHIFDPGLLILGGGISQVGKPLIADIRKRLDRMIMPSFAQHTRIKSSVLINDAPLVGMASILEKDLALVHMKTCYK